MPRYLISERLQITRLFKEFYDSEKAGGIVLISCTVVSLIIANSALSEGYTDLMHIKIGPLSVSHWINDGLMTIFFLLIGLELEREIYAGELSDMKNALLPVAAALGGIIVPAGIYTLFNFGTATQPGAGIPMATDIAFALGVLSLLGKRVPASLKVFLAALAVVDDLGAIMVITLFYSKSILWGNLAVSLTVFALLLILNRIKVKSLIPYIIGGMVMWYFMLLSGVHPTITGVLLAFTVPFGNGSSKSPSYILQHILHKPVAFFVLPLFALANTAITIGGGIGGSLSEPYAIGIVAGLVLGKPMGIMFFTLVAARTQCCTMPADIRWQHISGAGFLAGIGFTMSIFITLLAFDDPVIINNAKLMILVGSLIAGTAGFIILKSVLKEEIVEDTA
jgi:NhaA family Na+:H+ antiporter